MTDKPSIQEILQQVANGTMRPDMAGIYINQHINDATTAAGDMWANEVDQVREHLGGQLPMRGWRGHK